MIALSVIAIIVILLAAVVVSPIGGEFSLNTVADEKRVRVTFLGRTVWDSGKRRENKPKRERKKKPEKSEKKREKSDNTDLIGEALHAMPKAMRRIWRSFHVDDLVVGVCISRFDAALCAKLYGAACAVVYPAVRFAQDWMHVTAKTVQVRYRFGQDDRTDVILSGKACLTLGGVMLAGLSLVVGIAMARIQSPRRRSVAGKDAGNVSHHLPKAKRRTRENATQA